MALIGRNAYPMQSSLTTTATKPVSRCRRLKLYMADLVRHLWCGPWSQPGERSFFDSAKIQDAEEGVAQVKENLRIAQSRYKSYADKRRRELEFNVGDFIYLKVSPLRGTVRFHVKGKLAPRFVGPYKICKRIGKLAYKLELPEELVGVHPVFHVS